MKRLILILALCSPCLAQPAQPVLSPAQGQYSSTQNVTCSCSTGGTSCYYGINLVNSTPNSGSILYTKAIPITTTTDFNGVSQVEAICYSSGAGTSSESASTYVVTNVPGSTPTVPFTVTPGSPIVTVPSDFTGLSFEIADLYYWNPGTCPGATNPYSVLSNTTFLHLLENLGTGLVRFGGTQLDEFGSPTSGTFFTTTSGQCSFPGYSPHNVNYPSHLLATAQFFAAANWKITLGLNLGVNSPTAAGGVAEVNYVFGNSTVLPVVKYFEIGNEPDVYNINGTKSSGYGYNNYCNTGTGCTSGTDMHLYIADLLAAQPTAPLAGPQVASTNIRTTWIQGLAAAAHGSLATLVTHFYPNTYATGRLLDKVYPVTPGYNYPLTITTSNTETTLSALATQGLPIRIGETSSESFILPQNDISETYIATLWGVDFMFQAALQGYAGINFHGTWDDGFCGNFSATGVSPICVTSGGVMTPLPLYYSELVFHYAVGGRGTTQIIPISGTFNNVSAYAVLLANGNENVVIINKHPSQPISAAITAGNSYTTGVAQQLVATSMLDQLSGITFGGNAVATNGTWSAGSGTTVTPSAGVFTANVPAQSVVVLSLSGTDTLTVNPATPSLTLTSSASSIPEMGSVTLMATASGASGATAPTGTVTFDNGSTMLGTGTLNGMGVATLEVMNLPLGANSITASYGGDTNYTSATSEATIVNVLAPSFNLSSSNNALTISQGQSGSATISLTPVGGFSSAVQFSCSGLPEYSTCTFSPQTITPSGSAATTTTMTISTNVATRMLAWLAGISYAEVLLLSFGGIRRGRRNGRRILGVSSLLLGAIALSGAVGCGSGSAPKNVTPPGASTVTVTGTSGSLVQTVTLNVTIIHE